ncbi:type VII secretion-associated serine protease mycosin [Mycolicibacterium sp.]|uniref:type VII secretion-associated serine protease mycosin n=1 Tax=Mycolicibacterium sp. TaxID=2320850 RepID=UPI003D138BEB
MLRRAAVVLVVMGTAMAPAAAHAVDPPSIPPGPPPAGPVAPLGPTEQRAACAVGALLPGSRPDLAPAAEQMLDYRGAWRFARGAGQKVAVIDTGVTAQPRLRVEPGGDYVADTDGLVDCDGHGTLIAGLIAASPAPGDAFAGVAPDAVILSIRQGSAAYTVPGGGATPTDPSATSAGYGNTLTAALAVTRAVDLGATVIAVTQPACAPVGSNLADGALAQAVRYAFERDVVVVAAAGNVGSQGYCSAQNEVRDPNRPLVDAWRSVRTVSSPAWFADYVLTVAAVAPDGAPSTFSLRGPWVDVAAPGERLTSLSSSGAGLVTGFTDPQGNQFPLNGTDLAAALVSGVVALVRSRFPDMSAAEVMDRIERTARTPGAGPDPITGYGIIDPLAALSFQVPDRDQMPSPTTARTLAAPPGPSAGDHRARDIMLAMIGTSLALSAAALAVSTRQRTRASNGRTTGTEGV